MKKYFLLLYILFLSGNAFSQLQELMDDLKHADNRIESCYALLQNDTLVIGNEFIERRFKWNKGNLISIDIFNKKSSKVIKIDNSGNPDFGIDGVKVKNNKSIFSKEIVEATPIVPAFLSAEIIRAYEGFEVKQRYKIFPSSMAIACEYYIKKTDKTIVLDEDDIYIENLTFSSIHWEVEAIEFFDNTDHHDNLVKNRRIIPFGSDKYKGNLLFMRNPVENSGIFLLKEAPCSSVQNNYPGYDFMSSFNYEDHPLTFSVKSVGLGITDKDLKINEWIKTYTYVLGVHDNTGFGEMAALRSYQKNNRIFNPERDEMIMVNTWGDRNRDANINEDFILRELIRAYKLGFSHYMIDDGWQEGLSTNSAVNGEQNWDQWSVEDWQPAKKRFPSGFDNILKLADSLNIEMGLWFHPSNKDEYAKWEQDADILLNLFNQFGIKYIKIDGVQLPTKLADTNLRRFFDRVLEETEYQVVFSLDATANNRYGYHYNADLGNIFLENRYTDWQNYYPYKTLRNIWMLGKYLPAQKIQLEFLNKWRNTEKYGDDPFAPINYSFDYLFAITIPSQSLAWFETTSLPEEAEKSSELFNTIKILGHELHTAAIFPIGNEPNGASFTGFQFISSESEGFILVFRELNDEKSCNISTMFEPGSRIKFHKVYGNSSDFKATSDKEGKVSFSLNEPNSFCLFRYEIK